MSIELASYGKDFSTALAKTRLAEMTDAKVVPIPVPKPKKPLPPPQSFPNGQEQTGWFLPRFVTISSSSGVSVSFYRVSVSFSGVSVSLSGVSVSLSGVSVSFSGISVNFSGVSVMWVTE